MRALLLAALAALSPACDRREPAAPPAQGEAPPPLSAAAAAQVRDACAVFVAQVCGCAAATPADAELAEQCASARAIPGALELSLAGAQAPTGSALDQRVVQANVGKIQKGCVEESARLEARCPRARFAPPR
jgi:hypothetical protein